MKKFEYMKRLYSTLRSYINPYDTSDVVVSGTTADFDRLFELSWKTLKEYLYDWLGIPDAKSGSPKLIISLAYKEGLINNELVWLDMLRYRNDDTHHYNMSNALVYIGEIDCLFLDEIRQLIETLKPLIPEEKINSNKVPESLMDYCKEQGVTLACILEYLKKRYGYASNEDVYLNWDNLKPEIKSRGMTPF